ncbi:MAG: hypothetical protein V4665_01875 [Patescibacteria group bacterium]
MNSEAKNCQNCKKNFTIEPEDFSFYEKIKVPPPLWCPDCRNERRMLYRNFKTLYKRNSDLSGEPMISMYAPDAPYTVYESAEWWSDSWDAISYGMDVDFSRLFFNELNELFKKVPRTALVRINCVNSDYVNMAIGSTNCYLCFGCVENEDCDYGHIIWNSRDTIDNLYLFKSESCYECIDCLSSNKLFYSQECEGCADSIGLFDCRSCTDCIGCVGLIGKSYHVFNQQVDKETYKQIKNEMMPLTPEKISIILAKREELRRNLPQRSFFGSHNNDVSGNHIYNSHNIHHSFDIKGGEDSKYVYTVRNAVDTYDGSFSVTLDSCYEALNCVGKNIYFSHLCIDSHDIMYSDSCFNCHELFGCFGLRNKSYCILNKQYSKDEYYELRDKLIEFLSQKGEFGSFFPTFMSPFAYNESIVNEYVERSEEEALEFGSQWKHDIPSTMGQGTMEWNALPENPEEYDESLTTEIFTCEACEKNYRLIPREIAFYRRMGIVIPRECFNCRHAKRMHARFPRTLYDGVCAHCGTVIRTPYDKDKQSLYHLFCEHCYQQEVV